MYYEYKVTIATWFAKSRYSLKLTELGTSFGCDDYGDLKVVLDIFYSLLLLSLSLALASKIPINILF